MAQISEEEWREIRHLLSIDEILSARVVQLEHYGIVVEIVKLSDNDIDKLALVRVPDVSDIVSLTPEFPLVGEVIEAVVLKFCDRDYRIWLSTKPSEFERVKGF